MALQVLDIPRIFKWGGTELPDPNPNMNPDEVRKHYAVIYPDITNSIITGPSMTEVDGKTTAVYTIGSASYGTKG